MRFESRKGITCPVGDLRTNLRFGRVLGFNLATTSQSVGLSGCSFLQLHVTLHYCLDCDERIYLLLDGRVLDHLHTTAAGLWARCENSPTFFHLVMGTAMRRDDTGHVPHYYLGLVNHGLILWRFGSITTPQRQIRSGYQQRWQ